MSELRKALERMVAISNAKDEEWIVDTMARTRMNRPVVEHAHKELIALAQRSAYSVREIEADVTAELQRGVVLTAAVRAVTLRVTGGTALRVARRKVKR